MKEISPEELERGKRLVADAFDGPWRYRMFEIECLRCDSFEQGLTDTECVNPECNDSEVPAAFVEAPEQYPGESDEYHAQIVATIDVPGLSSLAEKNGECICWLRNNADALISAKAELDELVTVLQWLAMSFPHDVTIGEEQARTVRSVIEYAKSLGWKP